MARPSSATRSIASFAGTAALVCAALGVPTSARAQGWLDMQNPQIEVSYVEPKSAVYRPIYEKLKSRQVLEELSAFMSPLSLTRKVPVKLEECGMPGTFFEPGGGGRLCYESVAAIER